MPSIIGSLSSVEQLDIDDEAEAEKNKNIRNPGINIKKNERRKIERNETQNHNHKGMENLFIVCQYTYVIHQHSIIYGF